MKSLILFTSMISYILTQSCENTTPSIILDCSKQSTSTNSCCFYKLNGNPMCKWLGSKSNKTVVVDGTTMQCDNPRGTTCGNIIPKIASDCSQFGFSTNSCCLGELNGVKGCYWWAQYYSGTTTYDGMNITCQAGYLKGSLILLLLALLI
jgi:hypothetical protein